MRVGRKRHRGKNDLCRAHGVSHVMHFPRGAETVRHRSRHLEDPETMQLRGGAAASSRTLARFLDAARPERVLKMLLPSVRD
jgi:hypothetical protein